MKQNKLLEMMFDHSRWEMAVDKANEKHINLTVLKELAKPHVRVQLYQMIVNEQLELSPSHMAQIPKDTPGEFRTVFIAEDVDRVILSIINDCLFELFPDMVHPQCRSYKSGESCGKTVQEVSRKIVKLTKNTNNNHIGMKYDFKKYFDNVDLNAILNVFDEVEKRLGFEKGTEPVMNLLRKYYKSNLVFDLDGNLTEMYMGLRQGVATASFLADVILYELDEYMSNKYECYYRYSDDLVVITKDTSEITDDINKIICKYGVTLNPKKVECLYNDKWFKFLGFNIKGNMITLSKNRVKKFQKEIVSRTLDKPNITFDQARKNIINYLYIGDYCWATSCLGVINCKQDINEMNKFILDCLRAVKVRETKKRKDKVPISKIGGLGVVTNLPDRTILRGTGKNVTSNRNKTDKHIENYLTMGCLSNAIKMNKAIYQACVRSL